MEVVFWLQDVNFSVRMAKIHADYIVHKCIVHDISILFRYINLMDLEFSNFELFLVKKLILSLILQ